MPNALEQLLETVHTKDRYSVPAADLVPMQMEAARQRMAQHGASIQAVGTRIEDTGIKTIGEPADLVPLLFDHTAYKSYPESWLENEKWDMLGQWLDTVTSEPVGRIARDAMKGIDDWIAQLADRGHYISCSSGTSGKISMIPSTLADRQFVKQNFLTAYEWATGVAPSKDYMLVTCVPSSNNFRYIDTWDVLIDQYCGKDATYLLPVEPVTVGRVREMVRLRNAIKDSARPADLEAFKTVSAQREQAMADAVQGVAQALVEARGRKLIISGMFAPILKVAEMVREMGFSGQDFHPDNLMMVAGGLKGAEVPADYREQVMEAFNIREGHDFTMYAMQELNGFSPRCRAGRYHVPPWIMLLLLDETGEQLVGQFKGEAEGRAGFFDLSHEGRWGGVISGDKIEVDYGKCACGHEGPTIANNIIRFSDLPGGDKISCAGSIDAYVRGAV